MRETVLNEIFSVVSKKCFIEYHNLSSTEINEQIVFRIFQGNFLNTSILFENGIPHYQITNSKSKLENNNLDQQTLKTLEIVLLILIENDIEFQLYIETFYKETPRFFIKSKSQNSIEFHIKGEDIKSDIFFKNNIFTIKEFEKIVKENIFLKIK